MNEAYLCLGGNLGNCIETFAKAIKLLERQAIRVSKYSSIYISGAWGMEKAPDFYNQVIAVKTSHTAEQLMQILLETEKKLGRVRDGDDTYRSRPIDMDILFFNQDLIQTPQLEVPHPRLHLRRFVLEPLNEIAPGLIHPGITKTISQLLAVCEDKSTTKKLNHAL
jgi:2-amino-4-hydroxy-6-hydroxymethyldihydropteridine diphosphokinase